jgi:hypothetical protein
MGHLCTAALSLMHGSLTPKTTEINQSGLISTNVPASMTNGVQWKVSVCPLVRSLVRKVVMANRLRALQLFAGLSESSAGTLRVESSSATLTRDPNSEHLSAAFTVGRPVEEVGQEPGVRRSLETSRHAYFEALERSFETEPEAP